MAKKKNGEIELLRFLFSVVIMLFHSTYIIDNAPFLRGSFAVEFFFIVSGFLMLKHIEKIEQKGDKIVSLGKETASFVLGKASAVLPEVVSGAVIAFAFILSTSNQRIKDILANSVNWFFDDVLLLRATGLGSSVNGQLWYISSMLVAMAFLYPLLRKNKEIMVNLIIPLGSLVLIGYLYRKYGTLFKPAEMGIFTMRGNVRAVAELGLGMLGYKASEYIRKINFSIFGRICISAIKWGLYGLVFWVMYRNIKLTDSVIPLIITAAVALSFSGASIEGGILNNKVSYFLGKLSLPLYVSHYCFVGPEKFCSLKNVLPEGLSSEKTLAIYVACAFANAFLIMALSAIYRKNREKIIKILKKIFISGKAVESK